jgi:hypothetical protein
MNVNMNEGNTDVLAMACEVDRQVRVFPDWK